MAFIQKTKVKKYVNDRGKRCGAGFLPWVDQRIQVLLDEQIRAAGSRATLTMENAEAAEALKRIGKR